MNIGPVSYAPPIPGDTVDSPIPGTKTSVDTYLATPSTKTTLGQQPPLAAENKQHSLTTGVVDVHTNTIVYTTDPHSAQAIEVTTNEAAKTPTVGSIVDTFA